LLTTGQGGQERVGHVVGAEQDDGQVPFQHGSVAQVVIQGDAGVVDQDVQRSGLIGGCLDLRRVGHVQG
jgi:hypothetical protein